MDTCTSCGKSYSDCRFPLSHGHATITNVKLPGRVARILGKKDRTGHLSLDDRMTLNSIDLFPYNFPSQIDGVL